MFREKMNERHQTLSCQQCRSYFFTGPGGGSGRRAGTGNRLGGKTLAATLTSNNSQVTSLRLGDIGDEGSCAKS